MTVFSFDGLVAYALARAEQISDPALPAPSGANVPLEPATAGGPSSLRDHALNG